MRRIATSLALVMVLGITTGWSAPATDGQRAATPAARVSTAGQQTAATRAAATWAWREDRSAALAAISEQSMAVVAAGLVASSHLRGQARLNAVVATPAKAKAAAPSTKPATTTAVTYSGKNHFWIPSLHMSYPVYSYACGRTSYPANLIYRWGCAGKNNVYLLGHAYGVMKPLHDLYVRGGLKVGMVAIFADSSGHVRKYRVTAWQVVYPTEVEWAIASQPVPSMTLQTCVGKNSEKRLDVRLVAVN